MGSSCTLPHNGEFGECAYYNYCAVAQQLQSQGRQVFVCGQHFGSYVVCCPIQRSTWQAPFPWQPFFGFQQQATRNYPQVPVTHNSQITPTTARTTPSTVRPVTSSRSSRVLWPRPSTPAPTIRPINLKSTRISEKSKVFCVFLGTQLFIKLLPFRVQRVQIDWCSRAFRGVSQCKPNDSESDDRKLRFCYGPDRWWRNSKAQRISAHGGDWLALDLRNSRIQVRRKLDQREILC